MKVAWKYKNQEALQIEYECDVFISYNQRDQDWWMMNYSQS